MATSQWIDKLLTVDNLITKSLALPESNKLVKWCAKLLSMSCDSWYWLVGLVAIWVFGPVPWREPAMLTSASIVILGALVLGIKFLFKRQRPEGDWGKVYRSLDPHSFPSGHAARALLIAILGVYFELGWVTLVLLIWAVLVAWSRVSLQLHYIVDVIFGWLVGAMTSAVMIFIFPLALTLYNQLLVSFTK